MKRSPIVSGNRYGRLVAQWPVVRSNRGLLKWLCVCDCGKLHISRSDSLNRGATSSCGCLTRVIHQFLSGGKPASAAARRNLAQGRITSWANPEHRAKMSRISSETMRRTNLRKANGEFPRWTKSHSERMKVLAQKMWKDGTMTRAHHRRVGIFRSKLEADFAQQVNTNNLTWLYEPYGFPVIIGGKERTYTPDFYIIQLNQWIEVKGFWRDEESRTKVEAFAEQYPHLDFAVLLGTKTVQEWQPSPKK